jgi:hypothetical protein
MRLVIGALRRLLTAWRARDLAYWYDCGYNDQAWQYIGRRVDQLGIAQRRAYDAGWRNSQRDGAREQLGRSRSR